MRHFQNILTKQTTAIAVDFAADALRCIAVFITKTKQNKTKQNKNKIK